MNQTHGFPWNYASANSRIHLYQLSAHNREHCLSVANIRLMNWCTNAKPFASFYRYAWSLDTLVDYAWKDLLKVSGLLLALLIVEVRIAADSTAA